jgi:hypothetical protein
VCAYEATAFPLTLAFDTVSVVDVDMGEVIALLEAITAEYNAGGRIEVTVPVAE